jgi:hypothetical protein
MRTAADTHVDHRFTIDFAKQTQQHLTSERDEFQLRNSSVIRHMGETLELEPEFYLQACAAQRQTNKTTTSGPFKRRPSFTRSSCSKLAASSRSCVSPREATDEGRSKQPRHKASITLPVTCRSQNANSNIPETRTEAISITDNVGASVCFVCNNREPPVN